MSEGIENAAKTDLGLLVHKECAIDQLKSGGEIAAARTVSKFVKEPIERGCDSEKLGWIPSMI